MQETEEDQTLSLDTIFTEPPRPPSPEPTIATYTRQRLPDDPNAWKTIDIRLVGSHPLWGHHLWNASRSFATYLDDHPELYRDRSVLELGAGGGLPGIVTAKNGAARVVLTDYPDQPLLDNLQHNVRENVPLERTSHVEVKGYIWGHSIQPLLLADSETNGFDLIIMSDLIFNHSQHDALLNTCQNALNPGTPSTNDATGPCLLVFYTHHRPHLAHRDMRFFDKARERGWICEEIVTERFPPMFPEDPGDEEVRATVHGWRLTRQIASG